MRIPTASGAGTAGSPPSAPALPSTRPHLWAGSEGLGGCDLNPGDDAEHAASLGSERGDGRPRCATQAPLAPSGGARGAGRRTSGGFTYSSTSHTLCSEKVMPLTLVMTELSGPVSLSW